MEMLLGLVFTLLGLALSVAALRWAARQFGAGNTGWGACLLATLVPQVVGAAVAVGLVHAGLPPLLALVVVVLTMMFVCAKLLDTTMLRALGISVVAAIVMMLCVLGVYLVIGAGLLAVFGMGAMMGGNVTIGGGGRGGFGASDEDAIVVRIDDQGRTVTSQGFVVDGDVVYLDGKLHGHFVDGALVPVEGGDGADAGRATSGGAPAAEPEPAPPPARQATYGYKQVATGSLRLYLHTPVRMRLHDGREMEGVLERIDGTSFEIERRTSGGKMGFTVEERQIDRIEAWTEVR